jgi:hypothetical protein
MHDAPRDVAAARALVPAPPADVAALFWDIRAWHAIWTKIDDVEVAYDDGVHQEFAMGVQRDGRREDVRTIRYRRDDGDIDFFSPLPPPTMAVHNGRWGFRPAAGRPGCCVVTARREYELTRRPGEPAAAYGDRRREYCARFAERLRAILDGFADHFSHTRTEVPA